MPERVTLCLCGRQPRLSQDPSTRQWRFGCPVCSAHSIPVDETWELRDIASNWRHYIQDQEK